MQDQVTNALSHGINAAYLYCRICSNRQNGRAAITKSKWKNYTYVTPEWITQQDNFNKVLELVKEERIALVAFDEAHLYHYWQEFRPAYKESKILKDRLSDIPLLA